MGEFDGLSPRDFEDLSGDLLGERWGVRLERFGPGADGGIDLRYRAGTALTIVQCKHYANSTYSDLKSSLTNELPKLAKAKPNRYLVVTSRTLTPSNKAEIKMLLNPWVLDESDILGEHDVSALLRSFPKVESAHPKLWMLRAEVLERIIHAGTFKNTEWTLEEAQDDAAIFVRPSCYDEALKILKDNHSCILSGPPGIGKTILARMLMLEYAKDGFQPVVASAGIDDAFSLYREHEKQFIYFDDFLGQSSIEENTLEKNEDDRLVRLVSRVRKAGNKRFVLTTREYILQDAMSKYERLRRAEEGGQLEKLIVDVDRYSSFDRAFVLYNHIWHSRLPGDYANALVVKRRWKPIIQHDGFVPRLIRIATEGLNQSEVGPDQFPMFLTNGLNNPYELWKTVFESHIRDTERSLLRAKSLLPNLCLLDDLRVLTSLIHESFVGSSISDDLFYSALRLVDGTFLHLEKDKDETTFLVGFANPSARDFLQQRLTQSLGEVRSLVGVAFSFEQTIELLRVFGKMVFLDYRICLNVSIQPGIQTRVFSRKLYLPEAINTNASSPVPMLPKLWRF